jgi:hypothetical protein
MFADQLTAGRPNVPARSVRAIRAATRRRLHEPRPKLEADILARTRQWRNRVLAAQMAGLIAKSVPLYAFELLGIPSIQRGHFGLYSDEELAQRLNCSARTVRRHRKDLVEIGLLESVGGRDHHQPCMVRPILPDGPVFIRPKMAAASDTCVPPSRTTVAVDLPSTEIIETESPPPQTPPTPPMAKEDQIGPALVALGSVSGRAPLSGALGNEENRGAISLGDFAAVWAASGMHGSRGYAIARWLTLSADDRTAISTLASARQINTGGMWLGKWLELRCWEGDPPPAAPAPKPGFLIAYVSDESDAWQKFWRATGQKPKAYHPRTGFYFEKFPTRWPPGHPNADPA